MRLACQTDAVTVTSWDIQRFPERLGESLNGFDSHESASLESPFPRLGKTRPPSLIHASSRLFLNSDVSVHGGRWDVPVHSGCKSHPGRTRYVQLTQIEAVFRSLKSELGIRPISHQLEHRADAHVLIAFLTYCLQVTLKNGLMIHASGLTPAAVFEKLATIHMAEVWIPMLDGRWLVMPRHTQPDKDVRAVLDHRELSAINRLIHGSGRWPGERRYSFPVGILLGR